MYLKDIWPMSTCFNWVHVRHSMTTFNWFNDIIQRLQSQNWTDKNGVDVKM